MKINRKLLIKIISVSLVVILSFLYLFISIRTFINDNNSAKGLYLLSEVSNIQNQLTKYHLKYGSYPKSDNDIVVNNSILCMSGFYFNKSDCEGRIYVFKDLENNFVYSKTDGMSYSINFSTTYDSKDMGCVHKSNEKKKGCSFRVNTDGLSVNK